MLLQIEKQRKTQQWNQWEINFHKLFPFELTITIKTMGKRKVNMKIIDWYRFQAIKNQPTDEKNIKIAIQKNCIAKP